MGLQSGSRSTRKAHRPRDAGCRGAWRPGPRHARLGRRRACGGHVPVGQSLHSRRRGARQAMHSVSGRLEASMQGSPWKRSTAAGGPAWARSRRPCRARRGLAILTPAGPSCSGLKGFDRFNACISHAKKSFCLGRVGNWAKDGNGVGRDKHFPPPIFQSCMPTAAKPSQ